MPRKARPPQPVPGARSLPEAVADRLHSAAIHLLRQVRKQDVLTGLGPARLSALSVVVFGGPLTLGGLAAAEQVRPPTMSRLVAALVRQGLVTRSRVGSDGRQIRIAATAKGARLLSRGRQRRIAYLAQLLRDLRKEELEALGLAAELVECILRS